MQHTTQLIEPISVFCHSIENCFFTRKRLKILMEHIDINCSLESQLFFISICSVGIFSLTRVIRRNNAEKVFLVAGRGKSYRKSNSSAERTGPSRDWFRVCFRMQFQSSVCWGQYFLYNSKTIENSNITYREKKQVRISCTNLLYMCYQNSIQKWRYLQKTAAA